MSELWRPEGKIFSCCVHAVVVRVRKRYGVHKPNVFLVNCFDVFIAISTAVDFHVRSIVFTSRFEIAISKQF